MPWPGCCRRARPRPARSPNSSSRRCAHSRTSRQSAPDDATADNAERARRGLQTLGLAIDADYRLRRTQPAPDPQQLARSQESVQNAAGETDRTLRGVYRSFTNAD